MLIGFGGPTRREEIRPFLDNVLRGRPVSPDRFEEVVAHYEKIGGRSPYNDLTLLQAEALKAELARDGIAIPIVTGMRNWTPYIEETLASLAHTGARRVLGFIMSAFQCEASWERYQAAVAQARSDLGASAPIVEYVEGWSAHPSFAQAVAARIAETARALNETHRRTARLVFTAHSIPLAMAATSPYVDQLTAAARRAAALAGFENWSIAYQSRSGNPRDPWLVPDIREAIRAPGAPDIIVMPIGFLCDHVEVLYDLDIEAVLVAREAGVRMLRAPTVGTHPEFIRMMAATVRRRLEGADAS